MKVSDAGRTAIISREGRRLVAYHDSVGVLTIGVGHSGRMSPPKVTSGMRITPEECDRFLAADLEPVETAINQLVVPLTQNQFDALASFAFNIGVTGFLTSHVVSCLKAGMFTNAAEAMMNWCKPAVLKTRREAERKQFLTPDAAPITARPIPSSASSIVDKALSPAPARGTSPAPGSATSATKENTMGNLLGSVASMIFGAATKAQTVATVASAAPSIIEGAFKSVDEAERGIKALIELVNDIRSGNKWNEVPDDITAIIAEFRKIMENFGIDHDGLNTAAAKIADLDSVATLKAKAA